MRGFVITRCGLTLAYDDTGSWRRLVIHSSRKKNEGRMFLVSKRG